MLKKFKELDTVNKMLIIITIIIMVLLIGNLIISIKHISQFNSIRNSGNDRWFQVEDRIKIYENKVDQLEEIVKDLKLK
mgnify:CR=1 FL=1